MSFFELPNIPFLRFVFIAGFGWLLDFSLYNILLVLHTRIAAASVASSLVGVTFSYFMSVRTVFYYEGSLLITKFLIYVFYNILSVLFLSFSIEYLSESFNTSPVIMKCYITPLTMLVNFLMMSLLLSYRVQYRSES